VANLSKTPRINFYQNRSSIVEVMIKTFWCVFMPHSVVVIVVVVVVVVVVAVVFISFAVLYGRVIRTMTM